MLDRVRAGASAARSCPLTRRTKRGNKATAANIAIAISASRIVVSPPPKARPPAWPSQVYPRTPAPCRQPRRRHNAELHPIKPQCVIEKIEWKKWDQTHERDEAPAFGLNSGHDSAQSLAALFRHLVGDEVARDQEGEACADTRARKIPDRSPEGAEESPARQPE